jgi:hypothetical protein
VLAAIAVVALFGWREYQRQVRDHPERFPWTALDLADPVGPFTATKLASLGDDPQQCRALLAEVGDLDRSAAPMQSGTTGCGYEDGMVLRSEGPASIAFRPAPIVTSCPVAASLRLWERSIQPSAIRHLGSRIASIEHFGSYSCRRINSSIDGPWSEHATADAIDISAFVLVDGSRLSILADWEGDPDREAFLRSARDEACRLFATVLSPDYNAAHRDHLHLDQASRGKLGGSLCR